MSPENKAHYESKKEVIHLLLTRIGDEIYSIIDACKTAHEIWIAIKRLQQSESLNIQDVKTNLFWEFGKFTSHDGESMESHYSRFYKMMNKMIRNNLTVATMQVNVQFLQQLQPEWSRTSSISRNKNMDTTSRYKNDNQTGQFRNQRTVKVAGARETVGSQEVPNADSGTDTKPLEQVQYDVEYNVFTNVRQHSEQPESTSNTYLVEKDDSNVTPDSPDMCDNDIHTDQNAKDERATLANLIANLKLDVDENKKIQKQLKKANAPLAHELKGCKSILAKTSRTLGESNSIQDSCLIAL
nr:hypothetical protein [Tanacetum cinerariifolium]